VSAFLSDIGEKPVLVRDLPQSIAELGSFAAEIDRHLGLSDFVLMQLIDHSSWLPTVLGMVRTAALGGGEGINAEGD